MNLDNLSDIISSLSDSDIENLQKTAQSLFGENNNAQNNDSKNTSSDFDFSSFDPNLIMKITRIMSEINSSSNDPRCDLIKALKPLLSNDKKQRADEALQILKMLKIIPLIKNLN